MELAWSLKQVLGSGFCYEPYSLVEAASEVDQSLGMAARYMSSSNLGFSSQRPPMLSNLLVNLCEAPMF